MINGHEQNFRFSVGSTSNCGNDRLPENNIRDFYSSDEFNFPIDYIGLQDFCEFSKESACNSRGNYNSLNENVECYCCPEDQSSADFSGFSPRQYHENEENKVDCTYISCQEPQC